MGDGKLNHKDGDRRKRAGAQKKGKHEGTNEGGRME
jgi:hypothetical protein